MNRTPAQQEIIVPRIRFLSAVVLLLALHALLLVASSWNKSPTYDEPEHLAFGLAYLEQGRLAEADAQRMPVTLLNALLFRAGGETDPAVLGTDRRALLLARLPTMMASLLLGLGLVCWSSARFGHPGGLLALSLYCLSPTVIAHARLVTNDLYTALAVAASVWSFWRLCRRPATRWFLLAGACLGLAQACKFSSVVLAPAYAAILLFPAARSPLAAYLEERPARWGLAALLPLAALLALASAYRFDGLLLPMESFEFHSFSFAWLKARMPWLRLPLPRVYLEGLDLSRYISTHPGVIRGHNYLFGRLNDNGWWYYYIVVALLKAPLGTLGLFAVRALRRVKASAEGEAAGLSVFLLVPALGLLVFFSLFSTVQLGIRYLLPALPLVFVWIGGLLDLRSPGSAPLPRPLVVATAALLLATALSTLAAFPDYISYTGELAGPRRRAWRLMADSNLEWGQDRQYLREYLAANPDAILNPETPVAGHIVVRVNFLTGVFHEERYRWLRENFQPAGTIRGSYLIYRIGPDQLAGISPAAH